MPDPTYASDERPVFGAVASGAVTSGQLAPDSVGASELQNLALDCVNVLAYKTVATGGSVTAACTAGYTVTGGGCDTFGAKAFFYYSGITANGYRCQITNYESSVDLTAAARCCRTP